jgi:hypothetical protein
MPQRKFNYQNAKRKETSTINKALSTSKIQDGLKNKDLDLGDEKQKALDAYYIGQNEKNNQSKSN